MLCMHASMHCHAHDDSLLIAAQVRGRPGTLLLGVQMGQLPDAKFLRGFAAATARQLSHTGARACDPICTA